MELEKLITFGQAVDAMIAGKIVVINRKKYRYERIHGHFEAKFDDEDDWDVIYFDKEEVVATEQGKSFIYTKPITWKKATWLEALTAAQNGKKVKEQSHGYEDLSHSKMLTMEDFKGKTIEELSQWPDQLYVGVEEE